MRQFTRRCKLIALASLTCAMHSVSSRAMTDARQECVGRYELSLPGSVDFAITTPEALLKETPHSIRFEDGEEAPHSVFSYNGVFRVTWQVPETDFNRRVEALRTKMAPANAKASESNERFEPYDLKRTDLVGWKVQEAAGFETYQSGRIFSFKDFENHDRTCRVCTSPTVTDFARFHNWSTSV
jgi:hypothetical protein